MADHPIQGLMRTALDSLHSMVDVNTVVGDPVDTGKGQVIIPVSRISLGFVAGGSEFAGGHQSEFPFGGGSGAGVSVQPVGFLVVEAGEVRMLPVEPGGAMERLMDLAPRVLERFTRGQGNHRRHHEQGHSAEVRHYHRRLGRLEEQGDGAPGEQDEAGRRRRLTPGADQPLRMWRARNGGGRDGDSRNRDGRDGDNSRAAGGSRRDRGHDGGRDGALHAPGRAEQRRQRADRLVRRLTDAVVQGNRRGSDEEYLDFEDELDGR